MNLLPALARQVVDHLLAGSPALRPSAEVLQALRRQHGGNLRLVLFVLGDWCAARAEDRHRARKG